MLVALGVCPGEHRREPRAERIEADYRNWGVRIRGVLLGTLQALPCTSSPACL